MQNLLPKIAIIGTGIAGLACAAELHGHAAISLFDKSRGLGGRMATRRSELAAFDHGVSRFSADADFAAFLEPLTAAGSVLAWSPNTVRLSPQGAITQTLPARRQWVASPGMSSLGRAVLAHYQFDAVHLGAAVGALERQADHRYRLHAEGQIYENFDRVILAMPPAQAAALLPQGAMRQACESVAMQPCHTLMLAPQLESETASTPEDAPEWDVALVDDPMLELIIANHRKPGRERQRAFVVQTQHQWSAEHIDVPAAELGALIQARLFDLFGGTLGLSPKALAYHSCHRWLYAAAAKPLPNPQGFLFDATGGLGVAGDWCLGTRVRHGFASGTALAAAVKTSL